MIIEKIPRAPEIERAVLAALMLEKEAYTYVEDMLTANLFYSPDHAEIYRVIDELYVNDRAVDPLIVCEILREKDLLDKVGGEATVNAISEETNSMANVKHHVEILREKAFLRSIILLAERTVNQCLETMANGGDITVYIEESISVMRETYQEKRKNLSETIREWAGVTSGDFSVTECDRELGIVTQSDKASRRKTFQRMADEHVIERVTGKCGIYRKVNSECPPVDWMEAATETLDLVFPLGVEELVKIMPGNIMVVAGESNAGKTAFLMNFARMNMDRHHVHYFSSEMGREEFKIRVLEHSDLPLREWGKMNFYERSENFADVIRPDDINIVDFLQLHEDFWKVGGLINEIHKRLNRGVAFIALQKNPGADHGLGGARSIEKARLYLTMEPGKCIIRKAKNYRDKSCNPNGFSMKFKIVGGAKFIPDNEGWRRE
jgi:hypothetical protein